MIIGGSWYFIAEVLFLVTCMVQSIASLVETAQSFDGFFASYLLGKTYALQLLPYPQVISWSIDDCAVDAGTGTDGDGDVAACVPFQNCGVLILSLGKLVVVDCWLWSIGGEFYLLNPSFALYRLFVHDDDPAASWYWQSQRHDAISEVVVLCTLDFTLSVLFRVCEPRKLHSQR